MASISTDVTVTLSLEEKELLEKAIELLNEISNSVCLNSNLFVDAQAVFYCLDETYKQNKKKLPTVVNIWE